MRLAFIAPGNSIHTRRWLEFFAARGHEVGLVAYGPLLETPAGAEVLLELPRLGRGGGGPFRIVELGRGALRARRALRRFAPDLVHAHYLTGPGWLGLAAGIRPLVLGGWGSDVLVDGKRPFVRALHRATVRRAAAATCDAHAVADGLVALGMPAERVHVILWGVDTTLFAPGSADTACEDFRVLAIRGIRPVQSPTTIVEAFAQLAEKLPARLGLMLGQLVLALPATLRERIDALGIEALVDVVPGVRHEDLPQLYRAADACVSIPTSDGTSVAVLEAMSCGKPVVVSDIPANRDLIDDGRTGLIVPGGDPSALARALERLAREPELRRRLGTAARQHVVEHAESSVTLAAAEELYRSLLPSPDASS